MLHWQLAAIPVTAFANQASIALQNARLFEQVQAARKRMQTLSHRLVAVQEEERHRVAHELHDEMAQILTGLDLTLEMGRRLSSDALKANLDEAQALVQELLSRVHNLTLKLRPPVLDDLGLLATLLWHFQRYTAQTNVRVKFKHIGLEGRRFPPVVETTAFRIVQEALTNVARHAHVREVTVHLRADQNALDAQIEDRGAGFDPEAALVTETSVGLAGIRERAILVGGQLTVDSTAGAGTYVRAELPLGDRLEQRGEQRHSGDDYASGRQRTWRKC